MATESTEGGDRLPSVASSDTPTLSEALKYYIEASQSYARRAFEGLPSSVEAGPSLKITVESKPVDRRVNSTGVNLSVVRILNTGQEYQQYLQWAAGIDFILLRAVALKRGIVLSVSEALRSTARQAELYRQKPESAAPPGTSAHEKGLAIDINVGADGERGRVPVGNPSYEFMQSVGPQFGFTVLRDAQGKIDEAWHYSHPGNQVYGNVEGLTVSVDTSELPSAVAAQIQTALASKSTTQSFYLGFLASADTSGRQAKLDRRALDLLRYGAAINRAALATLVRKDGQDLNGLLRSINGFEGEITLPLYDPATGLWADGSPV